MLLVPAGLALCSEGGQAQWSAQELGKLRGQDRRIKGGREGVRLRPLSLYLEHLLRLADVKPLFPVARPERVNLDGWTCEPEMPARQSRA